MRLTRSFPDHIISMEALESRYERALKGEDFEERVFVIVEKAADRPVGMARILINQYTKRVTSADIGLMIAEKDCRGKGYGTEVVQLLLREVFEQLNLHRVSYWTVTDNIASVALARKMGFKEEGLLREEIFFDGKYHDSIAFGLLREEYESVKGRVPPALKEFLVA